MAQKVDMLADTLKTLVMSEPGGAGTGTYALARGGIAKHGLRGLYRAYLAAGARQGPVMVLQMYF